MDIRNILKMEEVIKILPNVNFTGALCLTATLILLLTLLFSPAPEEPLVIEPLRQDAITVFPDFTEIADISDKKRQFLDYMEGFVAAESQSIYGTRSDLLLIKDIVDKGEELSDRDAAKIVNLGETYRIDVENKAIEDIINELALRIDLIPVSMALAQAANESAWGTSRFTVEGNNVFGQWCYEEGCGIVPARRVSGAKHEVEYFDTVESSVKAYFLNINTHDSYAYLRDLRLKMRERNLKLDPMSLSIGLGRYSQRGSGYVDEIQRIILQNDLRDRDILF